MALIFVIVQYHTSATTILKISLVIIMVHYLTVIAGLQMFGNSGLVDGNFQTHHESIKSLGHEFAGVKFLDHDGLRHDEHNKNVLRQNFDYNSKVVI